MNLKCALYEQVLFTYRLKLYALLSNGQNEAVFIDRDDRCYYI